MKMLFMILSVIVTTMDTTICLDSTIAMTSAFDKKHYRWRDASTGDEIDTMRTINFTAAHLGDYTFTCEPYNDSTELHDAMEGANGDFESGYAGFTSDFDPISKGGVPVVNPKWVYSNNYDNGSDYGHYYMITNNAYDIQKSGIFKEIRPHGGNEFLLVDADSEGYAWKVSDLAVVAGKTYEFSYWATIPNTGAELSKPKAKLQFIIQYKDQYGFMSGDIPLLATPHELGTEPGDEKWQWHQKKATWVAPADAVSVTIGVKDLTTSAEGNDFCLDDIVFMPQGEPQSAIVETFKVHVEDCTPEPPVITCIDVIYRKWNDVLVVNNDKDTLMTYQWYQDGTLLEGETLQYLRRSDMAGHSYMVKGLTTKGKTYEACEVMHFEDAPRAATLVEVPTAVSVRRHFVGAHLVIEETIYSDGSREVVKKLQ